MEINSRSIYGFICKSFSKDRRTTNVVVNSMASAILKSVSMLCSLAIVPMTVNYLNAEVYGIWMAISSIIYWIAFMDIGLGNGMRNHVSRSIAVGDMDMARTYFSTAILYLCLLAVVIGVVVLPLIRNIDFQCVLNTKILSSEQLSAVMTIAVSLTLVQFVVKNVGLVYVAMQKYAVNDFILCVSNLVTLLAIFVLTKTTSPDLTNIVIVFIAIPIVIYVLSAIPLLRRYPQLMPGLGCINSQAAISITGKGLGFFIIQITSCLVIFSSTNILISHFFGPEQVTSYNVAYKYFNLLIIGYTIVLAPLWNAYTEAFVKRDFNWIRLTYRRSLKSWGWITLAGVLMLLVSPYFFRLWVGSSVSVSFGLSACVLAYVSMFNFANASAHLLNGLSILRIHILTSIIVAAIYLTTVLAFGTWLGPVGIIAIMAISYLIMGIVYSYQCFLVINHRASGIWSK